MSMRDYRYVRKNLDRRPPPESGPAHRGLALIRRLWAFPLLAGAIAAYAGPPLPADAEATHVGVAGCAHSSCHGASEALPFSSIQQNEYRVWHDRDKHAQSWRVLQSPAATAIARRLGQDDATQLPTCLACHSDNVPAARRGEKFSIEDGVGCEACHGGAQPWLGSHSAIGNSHAKNIAAGMYPTEDPVARAHLCMGCHQGSPDHPMTHRLLGAGHPRLALELDTFTLARPAHHVEDADYRQRKPGQTPLRTWALGQVQSVVEWQQLHRSTQASAGPWPELGFYECYGCHRDMNRRKANGESRPRLDLSRLTMTRILLERIAPEQAKDWAAADAALRGLDAPGKTTQALEPFAALAAQALDAAARYPYTAADARALLLILADRADQDVFNSYAAAEQATYASAVWIAVLSDPAAPASAATALESVYKSVDDASRYKADDWRKAIKGLAEVFR